MLEATASSSTNGDASTSSRHVTDKEATVSRQGFDRCFSFMDISIEPGMKSLRRLDSEKVKTGIRRWAKAVVAYSRQVSNHFGRSSSSLGSKQRSGSSSS